ncbi:MAG TPA: GNAT family N-acetyltransferase, partial [Acetobacteraceae bacterium]
PERWGPDEIAAQVSLPGTCGLICVRNVPSGPEESGGGFILFRIAADEAEVLTLAVSPASQRRGLGRRLLHAALERAQARGAMHMFLEAASDNVPALSLYAGAGFLRVGRRPGYYPGGSDALVLRRDLSSGEAAGDAIRPAGA